MSINLSFIKQLCLKTTHITQALDFKLLDYYLVKFLVKFMYLYHLFPWIYF